MNGATVVIGRCLLASLFILGGVNKLIAPATTLAMIRSAQMPFAEVVLPATVLLELGGGLVVATGQRYAAHAALALAVYTLATNLLFHRFWAMPHPEAALQMSLFFKNISIFGGLLFVAGIEHRRTTQRR